MASPIKKMMNYIQDNPKKIAASLWILMTSPIKKMMDFIQDNPKKIAVSLWLLAPGLVGLSVAALYWLFTPAVLTFAIIAVADLISIFLPTFISYSFVNAAVTTLAYVGIVSFFAKLTDKVINFVTRMTSDATPAPERKKTAPTDKSADESHALDSSRDRVYSALIRQVAVGTQTPEPLFKSMPVS